MENQLPFTVQRVEKFTVVELRLASLMDPLVLEELAGQLYQLVDEQDRRQMVLDFEKVQYISSQMIGMLLTLHKKIGALKGKLILCGVGPRLTELLKITRLDRVFTVKRSQREAVRAAPL
jgi:anti-sigma B factor antagonist